jgi:hypothetical protein
MRPVTKVTASLLRPAWYRMCAIAVDGITGQRTNHVSGSI